MELVLATRNAGKIRELKDLLRFSNMRLSTLEDYPGISEIPEDGRTFLDNAQKKARAVSAATGMWVLADDSGLVVDALGGQPGVHSARYAGRQADYGANNKKLLREMGNIPDGERQARFVCVMVLLSPDGREWHVEGVCEGEISRDYAGRKGFGFDPLFFLPERGKTMAELSMDEKNEISHRGRAIRNIRKILIEILGKSGEV